MVLHEYAWTHFPPWQFVEQHSEPCAHVLPSVVHAALLVGTGSAAHLPSPPQLPVQHCEADVQAAPTVTHAPALAHVPPTQLWLQHSELLVQAAPAAAQKADEVHFPMELQVVEQQSAPDAQFSPPPLQTGVGGASHAPFVHFPEQHSLGEEHALAAWRHWFAGCTHTLFAQAFEQQSALEPQTPPTALHCVTSTHVPVHAVEQQSEGSVQAAAGALHDGGLSEDPPDLLPHAVARTTATTSRTRCMDTSR